MLPDGWNPAITGMPRIRYATHDMHAARVLPCRAALPAIKMTDKEDRTHATSDSGSAGDDVVDDRDDHEKARTLDALQFSDPQNHEFFPGIGNPYGQRDGDDEKRGDEASSRRSSERGDCLACRAGKVRGRPAVRA